MNDTSLIELSQTLSEAYGRRAFGTFPTPIEPLNLFGAKHAGALWIKREDLSSSLYGGNKTRKLEFLLGGSGRPVLTFGPTGSHHVLATAIHANALKRRCAAVLIPQFMTPHHEEVAAHIVARCTPIFRLGPTPHDLWRMVSSIAGDLSRGNLRYQVCPPGGTSPKGTLGFVLGAFELADQIRLGICPEPEKLFVPLGTGGTAAGLAIGLAIAGLKTETVAVRVVRKRVLPSPWVRLLVRRTLHSIREVCPRIPRNISVNLTIDNRFETGYAVPTQAAITAMQIGNDAGIPLETTYSAKALAALIADVGKNPLGGPYLFVQTYAPL